MWLFLLSNLFTIELMVGFLVHSCRTARSGDHLEITITLCTCALIICILTLCPILFVWLHFKDEPSLNQSKKAKLDRIYIELSKKRNKGNMQVVHSIENADKASKEVAQWINDVADIHKMKQPPTVTYSKPMPDLDQLLDVPF